MFITNKQKFFVAIVAMLILLTPSLLFAWTGEVKYIEDGDTFDISRHGKEISIRFYGVDCPESDQFYGRKATQLTKTMINRETVKIEEIGEGPYGRPIAMVYHDGVCLNKKLVAEGLAWFG